MSLLFDGTNHPSAQQVINAGCIGALLYGGTPQYSKNFTPAQYRDYKARGLLTMFAFEIDSNDMNGGQAAGATHAAALLSNLRSGDVANTEPVCATVDKHITAANIPLAVKYQRGFYEYVKGNGWAGPDGGYGFAEFLIAIHDAGIADWYWGAGQFSLLPPYTNIWQDNTGTILVGGSADDKDWLKIPLEDPMAAEWTDLFPNPVYDPTNTNEADERSHKEYTAQQYLVGAWEKTLFLPKTEAQIDADVKALHTISAADLQQPLHDALIALGWTPPPSPTDTAAAVLTAIKTQFTK